MVPPDKKLVNGIKKGDQNAFKQLYHRYSDLLFAYISTQLENDKEAASDIWQETWINAVEKINSFQNRSNVFTWLCAIAKNKISDHFRLIKKQRRFNDDVRNCFDIDNEEIELVDEKTQVDAITVLALLPDKYRYLLMAKYLNNRSTEDISSETGKSYKATESMLSRARDVFREKFKQLNKR